jgi:peptidoglycan/xylan/chitin deacetylase (PgdA/CDA1 family)
MDFIAEAGISIVALEEARARPDAISITFDDAFANFEEHALPVLAAHRFTATLFVVGGYVGRTNAWPSQPPGFPILPLMSWTALRDSTKHAVRIGAHTVTHPFLPKIAEAEIDEEMRRSRAAVEDNLGCAVPSFAYPYGAWNHGIRNRAAQYFNLACTTEMRHVAPADDVLALPRIDAYYLRQPFWFERLHKPSGRAWLSMRAAVRKLRAIAAA